MAYTDDIEVVKNGDKVSLVFKENDEVLEEYILPLELARSLRSTLEWVISGRRKSAVATERKKGHRLPPEQFFDSSNGPPT